MSLLLRRVHLLLVLLTLAPPLRAEDGYRLWLRYDRAGDEASCAAIKIAKVQFATRTGITSSTLEAARNELKQGLRGLLGRDVPIELVRVTPSEATTAGNDGFRLINTRHLDGVTNATAESDIIQIEAGTDVGILYGAFELLRRIQTGQPLANLHVQSSPKIQRRVLNHWDNLNRFVERGYAGFSLWEWFDLPEIRNPRYRDYARACASIGINGTVLNNVNADALILTPEYLRKVAVLADEFRPYGIRVYLTARFSAPMEIGGLKTADPLDPAVASWWKTKVRQIYGQIPDFGGFLVKANSEGQPGPHDYGRTHADGANMLADALAPHDGIVMWRAFVYAADNKEDRVRQAYSQFQPLDGQFRPNVIVQLKNGPLDFMPREPFHPLFGAMPRTTLGLELQITQEYLGGSTQLAFLAPLWKEVLDADTFRPSKESTVARVIAGDGKSPSLIAGVANTGTDRNWTGHPLAQANWYAFGRLAWEPALSSEQISDEWTKMTFGLDPKVVTTISTLLLNSRETVVNYSMPLGLHHIMAEGHHYGPGPWVDGLSRPEWNSTYYHRADKNGIGFDRTASGSNALEQYAPEWQKQWGNRETCPENLLLWFHHVPWEHRMKSGRTLWEELTARYHQGVAEVTAMRSEWEKLRGRIDDQRFISVKQRLLRQEQDAVIWCDACILYFASVSERSIPGPLPARDLNDYKSLKLRFAPGHPGDM